MLTIQGLTQKIITALYNYYINEDSRNYLSTTEITNKIDVNKANNLINATLTYLTEKEYISESLDTNKKLSYRLTHKGIDYHEGGLNSPSQGKANVTIHGNNNNAVNESTSCTINLNKFKLSKTLKRRIVEIMMEVEEMITFLKKKDLLPKENEEKFKEWFSELEGIISFHDLKEPSKKS